MLCIRSAVVQTQPAILGRRCRFIFLAPMPIDVSVNAKVGLANRLMHESLSPVLYAELKLLAARAMRRERVGHTLQTTALVNEAWLKISEQHQLDPSNQAQFLGLAAQMMRRVLVDHARRRTATKRQASDEKVVIAEINLPVVDLDLLALDRALQRLTEISPRQAQMVDLKFFAGLELEEIAEVLNVARPTVVRDWRMARAWLQRELADA